MKCFLFIPKNTKWKKELKLNTILLLKLCMNCFIYIFICCVKKKNFLFLSTINITYFKTYSSNILNGDFSFYQSHFLERYLYFYLSMAFRYTPLVLDYNKPAATSSFLMCKIKWEICFPHSNYEGFYSATYSTMQTVPLKQPGVKCFTQGHNTEMVHGSSLP